MNITIVGGGNIGTQFAAHCAEKGHVVKVFTSKPEKFANYIEVVDENNCIIHKGRIECAIDDEKKAFDKADVIFITVPAFMMETIARKMLPFVNPDMKIGLIPGTGGGECMFKTAIDIGATVFGIQRVPSVARLREYGKSVCAMGYRNELHVAAMPTRKTIECCGLLESLFDMATVALPNYLCVTMTPSNPILHTTRLRTIFEDYDGRKIYDRIPLFYEEWNDASSELLFKCDEEVQSICEALTKFDLQSVRSLKVHYESETPAQLTKKICTIESFKGILTPMIKVPTGYIPNLESRYFTADFSYGLEILGQIGKCANVPTINIQKTLEWYRRVSTDINKFRYSDYGINTIEDLNLFYS